MENKENKIECSFCSTKKDETEFLWMKEYDWHSTICKKCLGKLRERFDAVTSFDKQICRELRLDYNDIVKHRWEYPKPLKIIFMDKLEKKGTIMVAHGLAKEEM